MAAFRICAYVSADIAFNFVVRWKSILIAIVIERMPVTARPLIHVVLPLTVSAEGIASLHVLFAARATVQIFIFHDNSPWRSWVENLMASREQ